MHLIGKLVTPVYNARILELEWHYIQTMLLIPLNFAAKRSWSVGWYTAGGTLLNVATGAICPGRAHSLGRTPV
jgi:hypothetical protein